MSEPRLLIVDDAEANRALLARRLARRGYSIVEAECGRAALEAAGAGDFDAVLLDVMMPDMDGLEALRRLRQLAGPAELPIIMVTARTESELMVEALRAGANDFVAKPVDFPVVVARLEAQVARKRAEAALRLANQELEDRVAARTADIAAANEQLRLALAAAEAGSRAKSAFLASISHELKTPLNAILGFSELLRLGGGGATPPSLVADYASEIHVSGAALLRLIEAMLEIARAETGDSTLDEAVFDLGAMLESCLDALVEPAQAHGVRLLRSLPADLPLVRADAGKYQAMFANLLDNALKFNLVDGEIELSGELRPDGALAVTVRDTGVGIEDALLPLIVQPFAQGDNSLARKYEGAGLGLPVAKLIAERHGGRLEISSRPGAGCTVAVLTPAKRLVARAIADVA